MRLTRAWVSRVRLCDRGSGADPTHVTSTNGAEQSPLPHLGLAKKQLEVPMECWPGGGYRSHSREDRPVPTLRDPSLLRRAVPGRSPRTPWRCESTRRVLRVLPGTGPLRTAAHRRRARRCLSLGRLGRRDRHRLRRDPCLNQSLIGTPGRDRLPTQPESRARAGRTVNANTGTRPRADTPHGVYPRAVSEVVEFCWSQGRSTHRSAPARRPG